MIESKIFSGHRFGWAWSYTKKKQAEIWAEVMRKAGVKVRIVKDTQLFHLWVCISDINKINNSAWRILKGKAYTAAERA